MLKEYIENSLKQEETINKVSIMRTQFTHIMSEFYFFNTFVRVLKSLGVDVKHRKESRDIGNDVAQFCYIDFNYNGEKYTTQYDNDKLVNDLKNFNILQVEMGMRESASTLVDIFLSLLL